MKKFNFVTMLILVFLLIGCHLYIENVIKTENKVQTEIKQEDTEIGTETIKDEEVKLSAGVDKIITQSTLQIVIEQQEQVKTKTKSKTKSKVQKEPEITFIEYNVPKNNGFKSYMPYTAITSTSSKQYKLQKEYAYTGDYGIRMVDDRYCVAIGTAFNTDVGTYFDLVLEDETIIPCIVGDIKDDIHTKSDNITTKANGCVSEFIVDIKHLDKDAKKHGDMSYCHADWNNNVVAVRVYDKNIFNEKGEK